MKRLDKLILSSFIGPFILTFLVVVFILLTQHMLKYFDDIVGKDIGILVLGNLMFDFSIFMTPIAIPLAVLLSSLMTFGNLGEHFELTAVKSAGISLLRALWPIFMFVVMLTVVAFYSNNYFVPKAALNAYSLLYDIKQKKPALDLKEGAFYNGIPDLSIKVNKKDPESGKIWDVIIYDHRDKNGNKKVTLADSGRMYTIMDDTYLVLEMYSGHSYIEGQSNAKTVSSKSTRSKAEALSRVKFDKSKVVFDLSSFDLTRTDQNLFSGNRIMRNLSQLSEDVDSLTQDVVEYRLTAFTSTRSNFKYISKNKLPLTQELKNLENFKDSLETIKRERMRDDLIKRDSLPSRSESERPKDDDNELKKDNELKTKRAEQQTSAATTVDNVNKPKTISQSNKQIPTIDRSKLAISDALVSSQKKKVQNIKPNRPSKTKPINNKKKRPTEEELKEKLVDFIATTDLKKKELKTTINRVRQVKSKIQNSAARIEKTYLSSYEFEVQWHKIVSNSFACLVMFLIGAPLGAIIKKGGLGIPVLISIFFFIVFYVLNMVGEKQAKAGAIDPILGVWMANIILLPIGLFFLRQARNDARLFDADFYNVALDKIKGRFKKSS